MVALANKAQINLLVEKAPNTIRGTWRQGPRILPVLLDVQAPEDKASDLTETYTCQCEHPIGSQIDLHCLGLVTMPNSDQQKSALLYFSLKSHDELIDQPDVSLTPPLNDLLVRPLDILSIYFETARRSAFVSFSYSK